MNEFQQFNISEWATDGVTFPVAALQKQSRSKRRSTPWAAVLVFTSALVSEGLVCQEAVRVPNQGSGLAVLASVQRWTPPPSDISDAHDTDRVSPEFWGEVRGYIRNLKPQAEVHSIDDPDPIV